VTIDPNKISLQDSLQVADRSEVFSNLSGQFQVLEGKDELRLLAMFEGSDNDDSGNANNGSAVGSPTFESSSDIVLMQGRRLDGSTQWINIPHSSSIDITGDFTLVAWIKTTTAAPVDFNAIYGKTNSTSLWSGIEWGINTSGKLACWLSNGSTAAWWSNDTASYNILDGDLHMVAVKLSGTTLSFNIDGTPTTSFPGSPIPATTPSQATIGNKSYSQGSFRAFPGFIAEIRLYGRALSDSELLNLKNNRLSICDYPAIVDFSDCG
jgi:hypothetical protein